MARLHVPDGPGGEAEMRWTLRPRLGVDQSCAIDV
jgi:hypothetical protein